MVNVLYEQTLWDIKSGYWKLTAIFGFDENCQRKRENSWSGAFLDSAWFDLQSISIISPVASYTFFCEKAINIFSILTYVCKVGVVLNHVD